MRECTGLNVSPIVYAILLKEASCSQVSEKGLVNKLGCTNPPYAEGQSERVLISQVLQSKSESTYGTEQIKLTLGLTPGKSPFLPYLDTAEIFLLFEWTPNLTWRLPG